MQADSFDFELGRAVVGVVLRCLPVNEVDVEALGVALDGLGDALAKAEQVINLLVLGSRAGGAEGAQGLHGILDGILGKGAGLPLELKPAMGTDEVDEHRLENHGTEAPAAQADTLLRRQVFPTHLDQKMQGR